MKKYQDLFETTYTAGSGKDLFPYLVGALIRIVSYLVLSLTSSQENQLTFPCK